MPHGREIGLGPSNIVRWGPSSPPPKGEQPLIFGHVYCGQTARWIKMALGTEMGLGSAQRRCDRWGPSSPSLEGARPPVFGPCLFWPNGWVDDDVTWYGKRPQPRPHWPHYVRWGPSSPPAKGAQQPPSFRPMSIVASVAHLSYC